MLGIWCYTLGARILFASAPENIEKKKEKKSTMSNLCSEYRQMPRYRIALAELQIKCPEKYCAVIKTRSKPFDRWPLCPQGAFFTLRFENNSYEYLPNFQAALSDYQEAQGNFSQLLGGIELWRKCELSGRHAVTAAPAVELKLDNLCGICLLGYPASAPSRGYLFI